MHRLKATGIVRRIDALGRIVIPKEICKQMKIHEGDAIEIYVGPESSIVLRPYRPYGEHDWLLALRIALAIDNTSIALYDRDGECQARSVGSEQLPQSLERPEKQVNCYEISDGDVLYGYFVTRGNCNEHSTIARVLLEFFKD